MVRKIYKIPNSYISDENGDLEIIIKVFNGEEKEKKKAMETFLDLTKKYIKKEGINSNINGYYNYLFENYKFFFTFKAREKSLLVNNNIHIQIIL
jgi:hypothetical protein